MEIERETGRESGTKKEKRGRQNREGETEKKEREIGRERIKERWKE